MAQTSHDDQHLPDEKGERLKAILKDYVERHLSELGEDAEFEVEDDLVSIGFDSVGYVRLLDFINTEFGVHVPDSDVTVEQFGSVAAIAAYLETRVDATGAAVE